MLVERLPASGTPAWRSLRDRIAAPILLVASRASGVAAQLALQVVVGSMAGAAGLGVLQLFTAWSCVIGEVLAQGLPSWAMRATAVGNAGDAPAHSRQNLTWAATRIVRLSVICCVLLLPAALWLDPGSLEAQLVIAVAAAAPVFALLRVGAEALKGGGRALLAVTLENLVIPACLLTVCLLTWLADGELTQGLLLGTGVAGTAIAFVLVWRPIVLRYRQAPGVSVAADEPVHDRSDLASLWSNGVLSIAFLQLPFLLLPWYGGTEDIGVYAVAHKLVNVVTTLLILQSALFGPAFARASAEDDAGELRRLLGRTQALSCAISLPLFVVLLAANDRLAALFSIPADQLSTYLLILAAGQLVNAATGLSGLMLNMSGAAAIETRVLMAAIAVAVLLTPLVGSSGGTVALAILFSAVLAGKNLVSYLAACQLISRGSKRQ